MKIEDFVTIFSIETSKDYGFAEKGLGFVVDGQYPIASLSPEGPISYIALLLFAEGNPRGDHYHREKVEYMTPLSGKLRCDLQLVDTPEETLVVMLQPGEILRILPGCAHTFTAVDGDVYALEFAPQKLDLGDVISV